MTDCYKWIVTNFRLRPVNLSILLADFSFWVVVLLLHIKDHLIDSNKNAIYHFSFQSYKGLNIPNQRDIEKGMRTRICDVIWLESQFCENLNDLFLI